MALSRWIYVQRYAKKNGKMALEREQKLNELGFAWTSTDRLDISPGSEGGKSKPKSAHSHKKRKTTKESAAVVVTTTTPTTMSDLVRPSDGAPQP
jgi:hypothetical protein